MDATLVRTGRRTVVLLLLLSGAVVAQPIDQGSRVAARRIEVPPISERITVSPINDGPGAFAAVPPATTSRIQGLVVNEAGMVVSSAGLVVVRSLSDGTVFGQVEVDEFGRFAVTNVRPGVYSAELVDRSGKVLTSSPSFVVGTGQIVQLTPVIAQQPPGSLVSLVGGNTARAINAAANAGVLAVATLEPISPTR